MATLSVFAKLQTSMYSGSYVFVTADGKTIVPTYESIATIQSKQGVNLDDLEGHVLHVFFQWDETQVVIPENATTLEGLTLVSVITDLSKDRRVEIVQERGASNDSIANAPIDKQQPIITMNQAVSGSQESDSPYFFDANTLFLPVNYFINNKYHSFALMFYMDEQTTDGIPTLELYHNKQADIPTVGSSTAYSVVSGNYGSFVPDVAIYCQTYNIAQVLQAYRNSIGTLKTPTEIRIKTKESQETLNIDNTMFVKDKEYVIRYKPVSTDN
jgi:hypothetical protein